MKYTFILLLCISSVLSGQKNKNDYWEARIHTYEGDIIEAFAQVPNKEKIKKIAYRNAEMDEYKFIDADLVTAISFVSPSGVEYEFDNHDVKWNYKKNDFDKDRYFLLTYKKGNYAKFYISASTYNTMNDGTIDILSKYRSRVDLPSYGYFISKTDEDYATFYMLIYPVPTAVGQNKRLRKQSIGILHEASDLVEEIKKKKYKWKDLDTIMDKYISATNHM